jgi:hypothetical protein
VEVVGDGRDVVGVPRVVGEVTWRCGAAVAGGDVSGGDVTGGEVVGGAAVVGGVELVDVGSSTPSARSARVGTAPEVAAIDNPSPAADIRRTATADPATSRVAFATANIPMNTRRRRILVVHPGRCLFTVVAARPSRRAPR